MRWTPWGRSSSCEPRDKCPAFASQNAISSPKVDIRKYYLASLLRFYGHLSPLHRLPPLSSLLPQQCFHRYRRCASGWEGDLVRADVWLRPVTTPDDSDNSVLDGVLQTVGHHFPRVDSMLTHFALLLVHESGTQVLLERTKAENVVFQEVTVPLAGQCTETWCGQLRWREAERIVAEQSSKEYGVVTNNSKRLAYNFLQVSVLKQGLEGPERAALQHGGGHTAVGQSARSPLKVVACAHGRPTVVCD